jgi:hypothetical protein
VVHSMVPNVVTRRSMPTAISMCAAFI